jgi:fumarate reductase subunit C
MLLLALLLLADVMFMVIHALHVWTPWLPAYSLSIEVDGGLAELFQYAKMAGLVICLGFQYLRSRGWAFAAWAGFFAFLLLDDAFFVHERVGQKVAESLGFQAAFGLRMVDFGEIAVAAVIGSCAVVMVVLALRRGGESARRISQDFMCLLALFAVFAVAFDALHTITYFHAPSVAPLFALIEDGGEMLVMSAIAAYTFDLVSNAGSSRVAVWPWIRERLPAYARG